MLQQQAGHLHVKVGLRAECVGAAALLLNRLCVWCVYGGGGGCNDLVVAGCEGVQRRLLLVAITASARPQLPAVMPHRTNTRTHTSPARYWLLSHAGSSRRALLRLCSCSASHTGTCTTCCGSKGPYRACTHPHTQAVAGGCCGRVRVCRQWPPLWRLQATAHKEAGAHVRQMLAIGCMRSTHHTTAHTAPGTHTTQPTYAPTATTAHQDAVYVVARHAAAGHHLDELLLGEELQLQAGGVVARCQVPWAWRWRRALQGHTHAPSPPNPPPLATPAVGVVAWADVSVVAATGPAIWSACRA
jgi:hypothetical protein